MMDMMALIAQSQNVSRDAMSQMDVVLMVLATVLLVTAVMIVLKRDALATALVMGDAILIRLYATAILDGLEQIAVSKHALVLLRTVLCMVAASMELANAMMATWDRIARALLGLTRLVLMHALPIASSSARMCMKRRV